MEAAHQYLRSLEGIPTLHAQVLQRVFTEFGDSYTLLDVYNISEKLELAHAHYEASTMRPPSRSRLQPSSGAPTRSSHSSSRAKAVHLAPPILPSCNYYGNHAHKANECNIPSKDLFCDYCGKEGHQEAIYFAKFPEWKQLRLPQQNLPASFVFTQQKAKALQPSTHALPTKGNSSKNAKKEHNAGKKEVLHAHAIQVQTLQNELESLRAQLDNLKGKSSQPASHAQPVQGSRSWEGPPRSFYALSHDAMVGEYVLSSAHNSNLTPEFATSFCPSYFAA